MRGRTDHLLATVLFTDIVDSSEVARDLGDRRWKVLLGRHHQLVRRALKRNRGKEVDNAGDGFFATFGDQVDAIRCACQISDEVEALGIEVRAGCHVGQAEVLEGKLGGVTVHAGARVMSEAAPGEVLVSSLMRELVPASGFEFADRGVHHLKGIEGDWHLYAVTGVDGTLRPPRLDPTEAERRRDAVKPPPIMQRPWGRVALVALAAVLVAGAALFVVSRPRPVEIRPESLVRIDPNSGRVLADVPVAEPGAAQIAIVPPHEVWVLSQPNQVISIVDERTNTTAGSVPVMRGQANSQQTGFGMVYGGGKVWVAPLSPPRKIEEIDPGWRRMERWLPVGGSTGRLAWGFGRLWVPVYKTRASDRMEIEGIDPESGEIEVSAMVGYLGYGPEAGEGAIWDTNRGDSSLTKIDPSTGDTTKIDLGNIGYPAGIGFGFQSVWVVDDQNGLVYRIDPATDKIVDTIRIGPLGHPYWCDIRTLGDSVWVANPSTHQVLRIDPATDTVRARITFPYAPQDLVVGYGSVWVTLVRYPQ